MVDLTVPQFKWSSTQSYWILFKKQKTRKKKGFKKSISLKWNVHCYPVTLSFFLCFNPLPERSLWFPAHRTLKQCTFNRKRWSCVRKKAALVLPPLTLIWLHLCSDLTKLRSSPQMPWRRAWNWGAKWMATEYFPCLSSKSTSGVHLQHNSGAQP